MKPGKTRRINMPKALDGFTPTEGIYIFRYSEWLQENEDFKMYMGERNFGFATYTMILSVDRYLLDKLGLNLLHAIRRLMKLSEAEHEFLKERIGVLDLREWVPAKKQENNTPPQFGVSTR